MAKLNSRLSKITDGVDDAVNLALNDTADFILTLVRLFAPVKTGALRDSYRKEAISQEHIFIGTMLSYAIYQEYGTSRMAAQPHLIPAIAQGEAFFKVNLVKRLRELGLGD